MIVDGVDLSRGVDVEGVTPLKSTRRIRGAEFTPRRSTTATARNRHFASCSATRYTLDVRAYNDGIAFRHVVPGTGERVPDEAHAFVLPKGSTLWHHGFRGHYEGVHERSEWTHWPMASGVRFH